MVSLMVRLAAVFEIFLGVNFLTNLSLLTDNIFLKLATCHHKKIARSIGRRFLFCTLTHVVRVAVHV